MAKVQDVWKAIPDSTTQLVAPVLAAGDLTTFSATDVFSQWKPNEVWQAGDQPYVKLAFAGISEYGQIVFTDFSAPVQIGSALAAGQGLRVTVDQAQLALKPLLVAPLINVGSGKFYSYGWKAIPAKYFRNNTPMTEDLVIDISTRPIDGMVPEEKLAKSAAFVAGDKVYGANAYQFSFGMGDDGVNVEFTSESVDRRTNGVSQSFLVGRGIKMSIQTANSTVAELRQQLYLSGFKGYNEKDAVYGMPPVEPGTIFVDTDFDWRVAGAKTARERLCILALQEQNLAAVTLSKEFSAPKTSTIELSAQSDLFVPAEIQAIMSTEAK